MTEQAALHSGVTPMAAETIVAAILVALVLALFAMVGYAVLVGCVAWVFVLVIGALRLGWASLCLAVMRLRRRMRRTPRIQPVRLTPGPPNAGLLG